MPSAQCIRMGALRLCLAMMLGLLTVSAYVVAPVLFSQAVSHAEAGMLAGSIFHMVNMAVIFLAAAVAAFWLRMPVVGRLNWLLLLLVVLLLSVNEFGLAPMMQELKAAVGSMDALAADDPQRVQFGIYHGISAVAHLLASLMLVLLVALGGSSHRNCHG